MEVNNTKTPVMVLQEYAVKRGMSAPEYSIIYARQGTHDNVFHYQVNLGSIVTAVGIGRSKQVAKHDAAKKALDILEEMGVYIPGKVIVKPPRSELFDNPVANANSIGSLTDLCLEHKIPQPQFIKISDVGPPHCKEFTYECHIASIVTRATAGTKKQAKQSAATEMLDRIEQIIPQLVAEISDNSTSMVVPYKDVEACEKYTEIKKIQSTKPNMSLKIKEYNLYFKNIAVEKDKSIESLEEHFKSDYTEENLKKLLNDLELEFILEELQENPLIVCLIINSDVPFTLLAEANSFQEASENLIQQAFEYLKMLLM